MKRIFLFLLGFFYIFQNAQAQDEIKNASEKGNIFSDDFTEALHSCISKKHRKNMII